MKKSTWRLLLAFSLLYVGLPDLEAKLLIMTHAYKRPDFIALQEKTFRAFLQDDYEFVVFNDASDSGISHAIQKTCADLHLRCIRIPQRIHAGPYLPRMQGEAYDHPCVKCANVVQYSLNTLGFKHHGPVMIIDSDMFLIDNLNVTEYMHEWDIFGVNQSRAPVEYLWNGILFFNMQRLPNKEELSFNCGIVEGQPCDVGGYTYYYLRDHPGVRVKFNDHHVYVERQMHERTSELHPYLRLMIEENVPNCEFFMNYKLFHYRGGGNWDYKSDDYHRHKTAALHKLIDLALKKKV